MKPEEPPVTSGQNSNGSYNKQKNALVVYKSLPKIKTALRTRTHPKKKVIKFPEVFSVLSWFKIGKEERFPFLYELRKEGFLRIVAGHGIELVEGRP